MGASRGVDIGFVHTHITYPELFFDSITIGKFVWRWVVRLVRNV